MAIRSSWPEDKLDAKAKWMREGTLVYALECNGWYKGEPQMVNRVTIQVTGSKLASEGEAENVAKRIESALNAPTGAAVRELVEAAEAVFERNAEHSAVIWERLQTAVAAVKEREGM